jgi:hypothetical protein
LCWRLRQSNSSALRENAFLYARFGDRSFIERSVYAAKEPQMHKRCDDAMEFSSAGVSRRSIPKDALEALSMSLHRQKDTGTSVPPLVTKAKFKWLSGLLCKECLQVRLVSSRESPNWPDVPSERFQLPFLRIEGSQRNTAIVLDDGGTLREQEVPHIRKVIVVNQIRGSLKEAIACAELAAELKKSALLSASI